MQIRSVMTSYCLQLKSGKYLINDISRNIEAVILTLGTINVHQKRNKMTSLVLLPCNSFAAGAVLIKIVISYFALKQELSTPPNLMMGLKTIWELFLFQVPFDPP